MDRRESLRLMASLGAGLTYAPAHPIAHRAQASRQGRPAFFTEEEFETVSVLADLIIPADSRSGSATDAGVPAFIDFLMEDQPRLQLPMRGGLAWLNHHARRRFELSFTALGDAERRSILNEIAWPDAAALEVSQGVAFFNTFRDMVASGFWSSKMGVGDLQYTGNVFVKEWEGCPREALARLGVSYAE